MASITTSPIRAPIMANAMEAMKWSGKKRRPIDPEETGSVPTEPYKIEQPTAKRQRTIDDVLGSLSLCSSDPPGNYSCYKRKNDVEVEDGRSAKMARSCASTESSILDESKKYSGRLDPEGRKDDSPTKLTSELLNSATQKCQQAEAPKKSASDNSMDTNEMAMDGSDQESDSSVSEGSIRNAMYQLVFGRRNPPQQLNISGGGGCGKYDAVDSKIEDIIRRSRMKAVIKSQKKGNIEESAFDMEMDADLSDGEEEWHPGHG